VAAAAIGRRPGRSPRSSLRDDDGATARAHDGDQDRVLGAVAAGLERIRGRFGARCGQRRWPCRARWPAAGWCLPPGFPGTGGLVEAVAALRVGQRVRRWQRRDPAGVAESRRAPGFGSGTMLYLHVADGIGGTVVEAGRASWARPGPRGVRHMPFGDPAGPAAAAPQAAGTPASTAGARPPPARNIPGDGCLRHVLGQRGPAIRRAVRDPGRGQLDRAGVAGLVNGLDPHLVVVGGLGRSCSASPRTRSPPPTTTG